MHFNSRVLQEAEDHTVPLIDRIKFLGIFSNNLDEFFRVRVATLKRMIQLRNKNKDYLDYNPQKIMNQVSELDNELQEKFQHIFSGIVKELEAEKIFILNEQTLSAKQGLFVRQFFRKQVRPNLYPIMLNHSPSFLLRDQAIYLAVIMEKDGHPLKDKFAVIDIPTRTLSRFLLLPSKGDSQYIILLDDVIRYCLDEVFPMFEYDNIEAFTFKFSRDAELDLDNDISKSFMEVISDSLKKRTVGDPVRFIYDREMPLVLLNAVAKKLNVKARGTMHAAGRYHNFKDFMSFPNIGRPALEYKALPPLPQGDLEAAKSLFTTMRKKDIMLHFPYQSFHYIIDLLREASIDPNVRSIRMTLYRAASNSKVINALINAARNGKTVTVFIELQARFDEEANLQYTEMLQDEGVRIIRGIPGFKVHCKLLLIRRKEETQSVYYANLSTGNFNENTAKVYADDSLLTADPRLTAEVLKIFELFEANYKQQRFKHLVVSPFGMRDHFMQLLKKEMRNAKEGQEAWAIIKLNNLVDDKMISQIELAARQGVKIKLIIRGICVLNPSDKEASENLEVFGVIDRFLEHSRLMIFCNGGEEKYYITSADWMVRNFDNRIEVAVPIYSKEIQKELRDIIDIQLKDNTKARMIGQDHLNTYRKTDTTKPTRSQYEIYRYFQKLHPLTSKS